MPLGCSWQPRLASILEQLPLSFRSWGRQSSSKEFRYPQCCAPILCLRYTHLAFLISCYAIARTKLAEGTVLRCASSANQANASSTVHVLLQDRVKAIEHNLPKAEQQYELAGCNAPKGFFGSGAW